MTAQRCPICDGSGRVMFDGVRYVGTIRNGGDQSYQMGQECHGCSGTGVVRDESFTLPGYTPPPWTPPVPSPYPFYEPRHPGHEFWCEAIGRSAMSS